MTERGVVEDFASLSRSNPVEAMVRLPDYLRDTGSLEGPARAQLLRHAALAARAVHDLPASERYLDQAIADAKSRGDKANEAWALITRTYNLFLMGRHEASLELIDTIRTDGDPHLETVLRFQAATILGRLGRNREAIESLNLADQVGFDADGGFHQSQVLKNRGLFSARDGDYESAVADLETARELSSQLGLELEVAYCNTNLAMAASYIGDLPRAFEMFSVAEQQIRRLSGNDFESKAGHCRALMTAGLYGEAARTAGAAAIGCEQAGLQVDAAELRLVETVALLERGELGAAEESATKAIASFERNGSTGWATAARLILRAVHHRCGIEVDPASLALDIESLEGAGLHRDALEAQLLLADIHTASGRFEAADAVLRTLRPELANSADDLQLATAASEAQLRQAAGDPVAAEQTAERGLTLVAERQSLLGAVDLRAGLRHHADRLAKIGLSVAVAAADETSILQWQERNSLSRSSPPSVRPPVNPELRRALARLRALDSGHDDERRELEEKVRLLDRSLRAKNGSVIEPMATAAILAELGPRIGVSIETVAANLVATTASQVGVSTEDLGSFSEVGRMVRSFRADLRARISNPQRSRTTRILQTLDRLGEVLLPQVSRGTAGVVVVPTPELYSLPWQVLPQLRHRPVTVATSLSAWARTAELAAPGTRSVFVAGPELQHAAAEVRLLAAGREDATVLADGDATVQNVVAAIDGAAVAHFATHGVVRTDNPLFSSLRLTDGDLNVYTLADLEQAPRVVILSACHVGLAADAPGQELLGMVTGFLNAGTSCVVASTLPVPDDRSTIDMMTRFHSFLGQGMSPAAAWAEVQRTCEGDERLLDTATFTIFGRG